jgi:biotin carboxylase
MEEEKPTAVVLGGTIAHSELILKLKNRGYFVVLVDYLESPPAKSVADVHLLVSTLDLENVLKVSQDYNANLVISSSVDQANVTACYVGEILNLTLPYSYELARNITNKGYMKEMMINNQIPTSPFVYFSSSNELEKLDLKYPVIVKPSDSCAANGVKIIFSEENLIPYSNNALNLSRNNHAIIEEFVNGKEISAYCFVEDHVAKILMISERYSVTEGPSCVLKCYATLAPAEIPGETFNEFSRVAQRIVDLFSLNNTPLHIQAIINEEGKINIIEFAPRVGGGISYETIRMNTGFDILEASIDSYLEKPVVVDVGSSSNVTTINIIYGTQGILDKIIGVENLIDNHLIDKFFMYKSFGTEIKTERASSSRIAVFIIKANTKEENLQRVKYAISCIDVLNPNGESIMRKDLYIR